VAYSRRPIFAKQLGLLQDRQGCLFLFVGRVAVHPQGFWELPRNQSSASKASPSARSVLPSTKGGLMLKAPLAREWNGLGIVCFGLLAEVCGEYLNKGRHIHLEGRLQTRKWAGP